MKGNSGLSGRGRRPGSRAACTAPAMLICFRPAGTHQACYHRERYPGDERHHPHLPYRIQTALNTWSRLLLHARRVSAPAMNTGAPPRPSAPGAQSRRLHNQRYRTRVKAVNPVAARTFVQQNSSYDLDDSVPAARSSSGSGSSSLTTPHRSHVSRCAPPGYPSPSVTFRSSVATGRVGPSADSACRCGERQTECYPVSTVRSVAVSPHRRCRCRCRCRCSSEPIRVARPGMDA